MTHTTNDAPVTVEQDPYLATIEEFEHDDQRELCRLYNHRPDDSLQFSRSNMREAIRHGRRLAALASPPAGDAFADAGKPIMPADLVARLENYAAICTGSEPKRIILQAAAYIADHIAGGGKLVAPAGDGVAERDWIMRAFYAEIDRQCGIGAGMAQTCADSGLFQINADIDMHSLAAALDRPRAAVGKEQAEAVAARVYRGYPFPRDDDISPSVMIDFAARAILALQSPPAKVEG